MTARTATAITAAVVLAAGCTPANDRPGPYVTEHGDLFVACAKISAKDDSMPGRWAIRIDHEGGWDEIPVAEGDYNRYRVGDVVHVQQQVGQLGVVSDGWCQG